MKRCRPAPGVASSKRPPVQGIARSLSRHSKVEPGSLLLIRIGTLLEVTTGWVGVCSSYAVLVTKTNGVDESWVQASVAGVGSRSGVSATVPSASGLSGLRAASPRSTARAWKAYEPSGSPA